MKRLKATPSLSAQTVKIAVLGLALAAVGIYGLTSAHSQGKGRAERVFTDASDDFAPDSPVDFTRPTNSSPITLSADNRLLWSVNPDADTVTVIGTERNQVAATIRVGNEPQNVAVTPDNRTAFVANAADNTVSVIKINNPDPENFQGGVTANLTTGAEPWSVVVSPDGQRAFVANSGQDTITVIEANRRRIIGHVDLRNSICNDPDRARHFQPRGLAVTLDNRNLYVARFFSFARAGAAGKQGDDLGREGLLCRLTIDTNDPAITGYRPVQSIPLVPQNTGFTIDSNGDGMPDPVAAFPNQLQSVVIRGDQAYLPNIAASPTGPLRFNANTHAFVSVVDGVTGKFASDAGAAKFLNLHLGARDPEPGRTRLFFANPWAIGFTNQSGAGTGYVVSAGSDLLVKVNVAADGKLNFTVDGNTTRYIDLNDPANPRTAGANAGKNPLGIAVNDAGTRAYTMNFVSRNVSVIDLTTDAVIQTVKTADLPAPGSPAEVVHVGAEVFFSSRGNFDRPAGATVATQDRLSSEGWQNCASCHFQGLTDSVVWAFGAGPRKSVPLNASFNPNNPNDQRVLNYSAIFDEVEDFELNTRNVSGPGALAAPVPCSNPPTNTSALDPNHGMLFGDDGDINRPPCVINAFALPNANRRQHTITLPGSNTAAPALTALREWVRFAVRTPNGPLTSAQIPGGTPPADIAAGRALFMEAGCVMCHSGGKWTLSTKDFTSPPATAEIFTERSGAFTGNPVGVQYLNRFLRNIGSFNLGVAGQGNPIGQDIGAVEKASATLVMGVSQPAPDALGRDYNADGAGVGYNVPSLLGILASPPFYHNGACETLDCVLSNVRHRTANGALPDRLTNPADRARVVRFLESITAQTTPFP
jgi:YVTN family beta-propeller protein